MNIRVEIFDVIMDKLAHESDYTELESVLAPLYSDRRLKARADLIFSASVNERTAAIEQALVTSMGLGDTVDCITDELADLLAPWSASARLRSVADQIVAATHKMSGEAAERAKALGAQLGAGAAFLVFEPENECNDDEIDLNEAITSLW